MIISELIRDQVLGLVVMFAAGMEIAFLYQIFRWIRRLTVKGRVLKALLEVLFWIAAAFITARFLYYCAHGQISIYTICGFACGALLWKICFYDIIYKICAFLETKWNVEGEHGKEETKQSV